MLGRVIAALSVVIGAFSTASAQDVKLPKIDFGRYHALIIGNNDYQHVRNLTTAVGDAEAVAALLEEKYGFKVTKLINATRRDVTGAFNGERRCRASAQCPWRRRKGDLLQATGDTQPHHRPTGPW